jgi:glycosyltransferase involved in cell wall biosynthesis
VLKSIYFHVDRIVVIDGAFRDDMPSKFSTDRTSSIVQGFDDSLKKVVYIKAHSSSQNEQRNRIFDFTSGMDWLLLIDDDEIYSETCLLRIRRFLNSTKDNAFRIKGYNFVNSFDWYYETANMRVWRIVEGMKFKGPNTIIPYHLNTKSAPVIPRVVRYHYSYVRDVSRLEIKRKQIGEFQHAHLFPWRRDGEFVYRESWNRKRFTGKHPAVMENHPYRSREWNPK